MWVKFLSIAIILSLSGCYSKEPKPVIIVVEKSFNLENINQQRLAKISANEQKTHQPANQILQKNTLKKQLAQSSSEPYKAEVVKKSSNIKQEKVITKTIHQFSNWQFPVQAQANKTFSKNHLGLSFNVQSGSPIRATRVGKIIHVSNKTKGCGQTIIIRHPFGFESGYAQTQSLQVAVNDLVDKGQIIASTNDLPFFFAMKKFETPIDPLKYLK